MANRALLSKLVNVKINKYKKNIIKNKLIKQQET
jgi:hypothetical protein